MKMNKNVFHDKVELPVGSECPKEFEAAMLAGGHLVIEEAKPEVKAEIKDNVKDFKKKGK